MPARGSNVKRRIILNELATKISGTMLDKKAFDIKIIDISGLSTVADFFVICTVNNLRQAQAVADEIELVLSKQGHHPKGIEGYRQGNWILMDFTDVIVHIFDKDAKSFYNIERIWSDGKLMEIEEEA